MDILSRYSDLPSWVRSIGGYLSTMSILFLLIVFVEWSFLYLALLISWMVILGDLLEKSSFPYYCTSGIGSSMEPAIPSGSTFSLRTDDFEDVELGDVVSYRVPENADYLAGKLIQHRIVGELDQGGYIMKGDGNDTVDRYIVFDEDIISKTFQYGDQPLYIPVSPIAIASTIGKVYKKVRGEHSEMLEEAAKADLYIGDYSLVPLGEWSDGD